MARRNFPNRRWTQADVNEVLTYKKDGMTDREISKIMRRSVSAVFNVLWKTRKGHQWPDSPVKTVSIPAPKNNEFDQQSLAELVLDANIDKQTKIKILRAIL